LLNNIPRRVDKPTLLFLNMGHMNKEQLDLCREIISLFNKASFTVSGIELVQFASKISLFSKMVVEQEKKLTNSPKLVEDKNKVE
jgi:hypothetical protein